MGLRSANESVIRAHGRAHDDGGEYDRLCDVDGLKDEQEIVRVRDTCRVRGQPSPSPSPCPHAAAVQSGIGCSTCSEAEVLPVRPLMVVRVRPVGAGQKWAPPAATSSYPS